MNGKKQLLFAWNLGEEVKTTGEDQKKTAFFRQVFPLLIPNALHT